MRFRFCLLFLILYSQLSILNAGADSTATGGTTASVTCDSMTEPDLIVSRVDHGVWVANHPTSAVWVWVAEVDSAARMTTGAGVPIAPGNANLFSPDLGWHGALYCLTVTSGTADLRVNGR